MSIADIQAVQAIDVHAHYGQYKHAGMPDLVCRCEGGGADVVLERARKARIELTIVSPLLGLLPRLAKDAVEGNIEAARTVARQRRLRHWVIVDPRLPETFDQARDMLGSPRCAGMKIHPEEHGYPITRHGRKLFELAAEHRAIVMTHSGEKNSLPADFLPLADAHPEVRLILAHLGCGWDGDPGHQVRAIELSKHGNMYVDCSSARNVMPRLLEWAVTRIGAEKILFGTDSPLYFAPMQRARVDYADMPDKAKRMILRENAAKLLGLG